jgi:hypothetical protein
MTSVSFNKVTALPVTLANSSIYYLATSPGVVEEFVTSTTGATRQVAPVSSVAPPLTTATTSTAGASDVRARADHSHGLAAIPATTTATTQAAGDSSTLVATTAFVTAAANLKANIASPTFTGVPAAPTASVGTNTTQLATTAFVTAAVGAAGAVWATEAW